MPVITRGSLATFRIKDWIRKKKMKGVFGMEENMFLHTKHN